MKTRFRAWMRPSVGILGAATVAMAVTAWPIGGLSEAAAAASPVTVVGFGSWDMSAESPPWIAAIDSDTGGAVHLSMTLGGDENDRTQVAGGVGDFAVSGQPYQPGELSAGQTMIAAPIMPSGLEFLFDPPSGGWQLTEGSTTVKWGPQTQTGNVVPWVPGQSTIQGCGLSSSTPSTDTSNGCPSVNVPANDLAAMYVAGASGTDGVPYGWWASSSILNTWPGLDFAAGDSLLVNNAGTPDGSNPTHYLINAPNVDNYYLQKWFTTLEDLTGSGGPPAPEEAIQADDWSGPLGSSFSQTPTEHLPAGELSGGSITDLTGLIGLPPAADPTHPNVPTDWANPPTPGAQPSGVGAIALTPPSGQFQVDQEENTRFADDQSTPQANPKWWPIPEEISVPNADNDFVAPTPAAIYAGVNAGAQALESACSNTDTNAMYAATHAGKPVVGAYPITWVDCMYVPSKGLTVAKTDAIAGMIRYLVTDGQSVLAPSGDGWLPAVYVNQALAAANTVVTDNCPSAGGKVAVTATPTGYTPISPGVQALGAVDECEPVATPSNGSPGTTVSPGTGGSSNTTGGSSPTTPATGASTPGGGGASGSTGLGSTFPEESATGSISGSEPLSGLASGSGISAAVGSVFGAGSPLGHLEAKTSPTGSGQGASGQSGGSKHAQLGLAASIASNLPDPLTSSGQTIDKLSALLLGGVLFLAARRVARRALKAKKG